MTRTALVVGISMLLAAGCGGADDDPGQSDADARAEAIRSLELTSKTTVLHDEMTQLVDRLGDDPSGAERKKIGKRLGEIDREAEELLGGTGTDRQFEVELAPINDSDVEGTLRLARSDRRVTAEGDVSGADPNSAQLLSVHALEAGEGGSVCPPSDAETGRDDELSASEAADFYGEQALDLGSAESAGDGAVGVDARADSAPADLPPLGARALVIHDEDELPVACGIPSTTVPQQGEPDPAAMAAGAAGQTHASVLYLIVIAEDPAAPGARQALERGRVRLTDARSRLQRTVERIEAILEGSGELDPRERDLLETARSRLRGASDLDAAFDAVEELIAAEERKQRRRERQQRERRRQERQQQQPRSDAPEPAQPAPDAEDPGAGPDADERDDAPENRQPDEGDGDRTPPRRGGGGTETCPALPPGGCSNIPQPPDCRCVVDEN